VPEKRFERRRINRIRRPDMTNCVGFRSDCAGIREREVTALWFKGGHERLIRSCHPSACMLQNCYGVTARIALRTGWPRTYHFRPNHDRSRVDGPRSDDDRRSVDDMGSDHDRRWGRPRAEET